MTRVTGNPTRRNPLRPARRVAAVLAVAAMLLPAPPAAAATAASPASTSGTICVGLVIDGTSIGGTRTTGCARVKPGSSGIDVLEAAGHTVTTQYNGDFVCSIDGVPSSGCSGVDSSHYWSYWHRAAGAGKWTYSSAGGGSYQPSAGSTDAWVYDDGSARTPGSVGRLCPGSGSSTRHSSAPTPAARASSGGGAAKTRHGSARSVQPLHHSSGSAAAPASSAGHIATGARSIDKTRRSRSAAAPAHGRKRPADPARPAGAAATSGAATLARSRESSTPAAAASLSARSGGGSGSNSGTGLWLVILAVIAAAGFAGTAWWRARRSSP